MWCYFFLQKVAPSVWRMQLTLIAGQHYFLEEPDLCSSRNITGISTWISEATEQMKIANTLHEHSGSPKKILFHFTSLIQKCVSTAFNQTRLPVLQLLLKKRYHLCPIGWYAIAKWLSQGGNLLGNLNTAYSISSTCSIVKVQLAINATTFEPLLHLLKILL